MSKISVARRYFSSSPSFEEEEEADSYFEALSHYRVSNKSFFLPFPQHRVHYRTPSPLCDDKGHFRQKEAIGLGGRGLALSLSLLQRNSPSKKKSDGGRKTSIQYRRVLFGISIPLSECF